MVSNVHGVKIGNYGFSDNSLKSAKHLLCLCPITTSLSENKIRYLYSQALYLQCNFFLLKNQYSIQKEIVLIAHHRKLLHGYISLMLF